MNEAIDNTTPSPSTVSSLSNEEPHRRRATIGPRDPAEALSSLQVASIQLEAAYRRMRQARRNIGETAESLLNSELGRQGSEGIGPGHEAITLTNGPEAADSNRNTQTTAAMQTRLSIQAMQEQLRQIELRIEAEIRRTSSRYGELFSPSAGSPPRQLPLSGSQLELLGTRRPRLDSLRTTNLDGVEGSTSLGRRVALREMAGSITSPSPTTAASSPRREGTSAVLAAAERDIEALRSVIRQRRSEPPQSPTAGSIPSSGHESTDNFRRSFYVARSSTRSDTSASSNVEATRRRRIYGTTSSILSQSPLSTEPDARLSLLSNFSVHNLPTPESGSSPRALIFEEPTSYIPAANFIEPSASTTRNEPIRESQDERSYVVRRRYNADGEEYVHSINMDLVDDDDDPMSWMLSRDPQEDLALEFVGTRVGGPRPRRRQNQGGMGRRRHWVRLDLDGDEIIEEESDLEPPASYHIRMDPRPYAPIPAGFFDSQETTPLLAVDSNQQTSSIDVPRIRVPRPPAIVQSDSNSTIRPDTSPTTVFDSPLSNKLFYPNPLPMPIESMVWTPHRAKPPRVVRIPKHANFAVR